MGSKWAEAKLSDISIFRNGAGIKQEYFTNSHNGTPLVKVSNFTLDSLDTSNNITYVCNEHAAKWSSHLLRKSDILIATVGSWPPNWSSVVGKVVRVPSEAENMLQNQNTCCLLAKDNVDSDFLFYALKTKEFQDWVVNMAQGSANQARIPVKTLGDYKLHIPTYTNQKRISSFLINIDDKIRVSSRINQTLEQMSQALFKSWFVDFDPVIDNALDAGNDIPESLQSRAELRRNARNRPDFKPLPAEIRALFPAEFEETELGWVPRGWIVSSFDKFIELIGGGTPKTSIEEYWNGDIPWFSVVDAPTESDVFVIGTEKNITEEGLNNSSAKLLRKGTTIISARGTVGKCAMVASPMAMNQSCYGVIGVKGISDEYIYFQLKNAVQTLQKMGHGSVFNTITRDTFKNIKIPFCGNELTTLYSKLVSQYFSKILHNNYENQTLTNLRDTLLPKLISGELSLEDLPDLLKQTEAA